METLGIEQYIQDDLNEGEPLGEALDRAFYELYEVFCNSLESYPPSAFEGNDAVVKEEDVLKLLEKCFKRKFDEEWFSIEGVTSTKLINHE